MTQHPSIAELEALRIRVGTVVGAEPNTGARDPAFKLWIDVGVDQPVQSSAKITDRYAAEELIGRSVVVVTGFAPIRIGGFRSDVLVLGALTADGVVLLRPDADVSPGSQVA